MWRGFDVGAVIGALPDRGAVLVAGSAGSTRTVSRARMVDGAEELAEVGTEELVVITGAALATADEATGGLIERLHAMGAAGVAVRLDASWPLPRAFSGAADRLAFPVITFPETASSAEVTTAVLDALLSAQRERLERVFEIHQRFTTVVPASGGALAIASSLHSLLRCTIAIVDEAGQLELVVPESAAADLDLATARGVRRPILAGEHRYGEVMALTGGEGLHQDEALALDGAAGALAVRRAQATAAATRQERFAAMSLEELIAGHASSSTEVVERAMSFGWDLRRTRAVLLASIDPPIDGDELPASLGTVAAAARATLGPDAIIWTRSTTIAALLAPGTSGSGVRRDIAETLRRELDQRLQRVTVSIGVGRSVEDPSLLRQSYLEASRAVDVGRWAKGRHVTEVFDELGLERLLASTPAHDLAEFVDHAIGALARHDRSHDTDLVEMLAVWLETRNMAEAARRVHVHHNTFRNRLDRVEQVLGPVLSDPARTLECEVAVYIYRNYDGPWTSAGP